VVCVLAPIPKGDTGHAFRIVLRRGQRLLCSGLLVRGSPARGIVWTDEIGVGSPVASVLHSTLGNESVEGGIYVGQSGPNPAANLPPVGAGMGSDELQDPITKGTDLGVLGAVEAEKEIGDRPPSAGGELPSRLLPPWLHLQDHVHRRTNCRAVAVLPVTLPSVVHQEQGGFIVPGNPHKGRHDSRPLGRRTWVRHEVSRILRQGIDDYEYRTSLLNNRS
jgi:hypothetical protein